MLLFSLLFSCRFVFKCAVVDFSSRGAREGISEFYFLGYHITGQHLLAVVDDLLLGRVGFFKAGVEHDKCLGNVDPLLVRNADNAAKSYRSVGVDGLFNPVREHLCHLTVRALCHNNALYAAGNANDAVMVNASQIAGVDSAHAVLVGLDQIVGRAFVVKVAQHDRRSRDAQLAFLAVGLFRAVVDVNSFYDHLCQRNTYAARSVDVFKGGGGCACQLRHAQALLQFDLCAAGSEQPIDLFFLVLGHTLAAVEDKAKA